MSPASSTHPKTQTNAPEPKTSGENAMSNRTKSLTLAAAVALAFAAGIGATVLAEGIPPTGALSYSGVLEEDGVRVNGSRDMTVELFASDTAGAVLCSTTAAGVAVTDGHFRVTLADACVTAIHANPAAWVRVTVAGEAMPRQPLGAVPYAVEADHAVTASDADNAAMATAATTASRHVVTGPAGSVSVDGTYCGSTAASTGVATSGALLGFAATHALCAGVATCSPTAHLCSYDELVTSVVVGRAADRDGWMNGSAGWGQSSTGAYYTDCDGWRLGATTTLGSEWIADNTGAVVADALPASRSCNTSLPFLCCD
jgi:hypothetical protein